MEMKVTGWREGWVTPVCKRHGPGMYLIKAGRRTRRSQAGEVEGVGGRGRSMEAGMTDWGRQGTLSGTEKMEM